MDCNPQRTNDLDASQWIGIDLGCATVPPFDAGTAIRESMASTDISCKAAAYAMGLDPAQWSRELNGDGHIPFDRLVNLPTDTQRAIVTRWAEHLGLRVVSHDLTTDTITRLQHALADCLAVLRNER